MRMLLTFFFITEPVFALFGITGLFGEIAKEAAYDALYMIGIVVGVIFTILPIIMIISFIWS